MSDIFSPLKALLIGRGEELIWPLLSFLPRAGYLVDAVTHSPLMHYCKPIRDCQVVPSGECIIQAAERRLHHQYDWIIVTEDPLLSDILHAPLCEKARLELLPVISEEHYGHLHSKIGLSRVFLKNGIQTPPFFVVLGLQEAIEAAEELGLPVFLKVDASWGGSGVFECTARSDFYRMDPSIWFKPLLIQKKIVGRDLDLSALYLEGELIHFSYSKMRKVVNNRFGPSSLRLYSPLASLEKKLFEEVALIGKVLGAHGFTNTSCIEAEDGSGRYYIEADMRPNVWVNAPDYFGEDIADRIRRWRENRESLTYTPRKAGVVLQEIEIPYFLRLSPLDLLLNRYRVWKFIPWDHKGFVFRLIAKEWQRKGSKYHPKKILKRLIPHKYHPFLKKVFLKLSFSSPLKKIL